MVLWLYLLSFVKRCMNIWCVLRDLMCWSIHIFDSQSNFYSDIGFGNSWCHCYITYRWHFESSTWSLRVHFWFIVSCVMTCGPLMWAIYHSSYAAAGVLFFVEWIFFCLCKKNNLVVWPCKQSLVWDNNIVFCWMFYCYYLKSVIVQNKIRKYMRIICIVC